jgi:hypothetical protein
MSEEQRPWPEPAWRIEAEQAEKQARAELRDRFAMAALTGLLADHTMQNFAVTEFADLSYEYADAMLKARGDE